MGLLTERGVLVTSRATFTAVCSSSGAYFGAPVLLDAFHPMVSREAAGSGTTAQSLARAFENDWEMTAWPV